VKENKKRLFTKVRQQTKEKTYLANSRHQQKRWKVCN